MIIDDYEILNKCERKNNNQYYLVRCTKCGHQKEISINNMRVQNLHHSARNCREDYYKEYIGKQFGDYIVQRIELDAKLGFVAVCKCDICEHTLIKQCSSLEDMTHSASRCKDGYYSAEIGKQYGDLVIDSLADRRWNNVMYHCHCVKCGAKHVKSAVALHKTVLHGGECTKQIPESDIKNAVVTRFHDMYERCNNPNNNSYKHYGGRGIKLIYESPADLYNDFSEELAEHARRYGIHNSTFDRIDVDGNYERDNIRVVTQSIQSTNTTRKRLFIIEKDNQKVISDNAMECGRRLGINGRSVGNVVRGSSKSAGGWRLCGVYKPDIDVPSLISKEGVTTNLIVS